VTVRELPRWHAYAPKLLTLLLQGYERRRLGRDLLAGLNVAVVALPLNLALAIAAGLPPQTGLIAGAIGGLLIALLGGSRIMIGGPTAAFVPVVAAIVAQHGTQGLLAAMLMAALMLIAAGALLWRVMIGPVQPQPSMLSKMCTVAQIVYLLAALFVQAGWNFVSPMTLGWVVAVLCVASWLDYAVRWSGRARRARCTR